jgi:hypothetical protein
MMLSDLDLEGSTQEEASAEDAECDATLFYDYQPMLFMSRLVTQDEYFLTRVSVATSFSKKPSGATPPCAAATSTAGAATDGPANVL